jgi:competence protein ComEC
VEFYRFKQTLNLLPELQGRQDTLILGILEHFRHFRHLCPMTSPLYFRPAIPLLIAFIGGILVGSELRGYGIWAWMVLCASAGSSLLLIHRKMTARISPIVLFVALGYLTISPWISPGFPVNHIIHYTGADRWDITGRIDSRPQTVNDRTRFILRADFLDNGRQRRAVIGKLRVSAVGKLPELAIGDTILFKSRIRPISNFKNPAGFDYRKYMAYKGIWATAYVQGDKLAVIDPEQPSGLIQFLDKVRGNFAKLIANSRFPEAQAVFKALIIGDRFEISAQTRQRFNRAGVGHLLAISGLHIGIVAGVAFFLFHGLMARLKLLLWRAWTRKTAALLSLLPVIAYGGIAGFSPSTQRAVIMVAVFLMTFVFQREQDSLNTLALAALMILAMDPPSLFSISFQLSFAAVFAIIYGFSCVRDRPVIARQQREDNWLIRFRSKLVAFFLVSFFAICGSLPLVAYYFNQISLVGLAANIIVVPLVGFITIPIGLAALFAMPLSMTFASWCIHLGTMVLSYALGIVKFFADLPFAAVKIVTPGFIEIACFYILGWALLNLRRRGPNEIIATQTAGAAVDFITPENRDDSPMTGRFDRRPSLKMLSALKIKGFSTSSLAKIALVMVFFTLAADTCYWLYQRFWHSDLRVTVVDVGNGSASLLELPGGYTILIDGGGFSDNNAFDMGKSVLAPLLWSKKIRTVDTLILSHPNSDHLNGLIYIADNFHVKNVWTNNEPCNTLGYAMLMNVVASRGISLPVFERMTRRHKIKDVELSFLYPPLDFMKRKNSERWRNLNNNSLVVRVSLGSTSFLFPGDIMAEAEAEIVRMVGNKLSSTVLIAPHHGSRTSSSKIFLDEVNPEIVIISAGRNRRFKLPHRTVLKRYQERGYTIWRTDINGAICMATDGEHFEVNPFER